MGESSHIAWTDDTWNPWIGCRKVSPGCKNCYAETLVNGRMGRDFSKRVRTAPATFNAPLRWNKKPWVCDRCGEATQIFKDLASTGAGASCGKCGAMEFHRRRVFSLSLGDWLDPEVPVEWLADMLDVVRRCPGLDFLLLTKRPDLFRKRIGTCLDNDKGTFPDSYRIFLLAWLGETRFVRAEPPPNVWIGTSVEDQKRADDRIPALLKIPAKVRFLSVEPLLEKVNLDFWYDACEEEYGPYPGSHNPTNELHWVIVGGESGPHRRDCGVAAIVDVARQCQEAGVPCFVKQDVSARPGQQGRIPDDIWSLNSSRSDL